jgi:hypothetical protein
MPKLKNTIRIKPLKAFKFKQMFSISSKILLPLRFYTVLPLLISSFTHPHHTMQQDMVSLGKIWQHESLHTSICPCNIFIMNLAHGKKDKNW